PEQQATPNKKRLHGKLTSKYASSDPEPSLPRAAGRAERGGAAARRTWASCFPPARVASSVRGEVIADYPTAFHYEPHLLERADISDRVFGDSDEIGKLAGLDGAYPVLPAEHLGSVARDRTKDVERGHAGLGQMTEHQSAGLPRRLARVGPAHVGSGRKFHAGLQYPLHEGDRTLSRTVVGRDLPGFHRGRHHDAGLENPGEAPTPERRGNVEEDPPVVHALELRVGHVVAMLDGVGAGIDRHLDACGGRGVHRHLQVLAVGLVD